MEIDITQRVTKLVNEQYSKMKFSKNQSNRARLSNKCQDIIYNEWGISSNGIWKLIDDIVEELISDDED